MSTDTVVGGRRVELLTRASMLARVQLEAGCELLEVTAEWIIANPGDGLQPQETRLEFARERAMVWAGDGTPTVAETAPATLGLEIGLSVWQSCRLVADVLDLRATCCRRSGRWSAPAVSGPMMPGSSPDPPNQPPHTYAPVGTPRPHRRGRDPRRQRRRPCRRHRRPTRRHRAPLARHRHRSAHRTRD